MHYFSLRDAEGNRIPGPIDEDYPLNTGLRGARGDLIPPAAPDEYPSSVPMASDDTQGDINHGTYSGGGMAILFFDSHVEFVTNTEVDPRDGVGSTAGEGLLRQLRN